MFHEHFLQVHISVALRKKWPCSELFWSTFSRIWTEYLRIRVLFTQREWDKKGNFVAIAFHQNVNLRKDLPLSRWNLRVRESKNFWLYTLIQLILRQYFKKSRWRSKCPPENLPCKSFFLKRRILINSFFTSQFNYCPLVWMFHSRTINNKINHVLERCLHILYSDKTSRIWVLCSKREKHFSWYRIIFIIYS